MEREQRGKNEKQRAFHTITLITKPEDTTKPKHNNNNNNKNP